MAQDMLDTYDKIATDIISPIVEANNKMQENFRSEDGTVRSIYAPLTDMIRNLPLHGGDLLKSSIELVRTLEKYEGLPWISTAKHVAYKLQSFAEDVKNDALDFYNVILSFKHMYVRYVKVIVTQELLLPQLC